MGNAQSNMGYDSHRGYGYRQGGAALGGLYGGNFRPYRTMSAGERGLYGHYGSYHGRHPYSGYANPSVASWTSSNRERNMARAWRNLDRLGDNRTRSSLSTMSWL
ncbi:hypothetical protein M8818_006098 [Zalaria obscura]|uniref:Uncharacterized protein n=1 Tax=Zalaria obscura TaxID=2024903 RepID=A0ACC3S7U7_9PEZI